MYIIIAGCGRLGSYLASSLSGQGHDIVVVDNVSENFGKLDSSFDGVTMTGIPIDEDTLKKAGIEQADVLAAVTHDDNMNIMTAMIAERVFHVPKVFTRISEPQKEAFFKALGLKTLSPTTFGATYIESQIAGGDL